jgi:tetratricopeptide (TPR) repeat protein
VSEVDDIPENLRRGAKEVLNLVDMGKTATAIARCDELAAGAPKDYLWHIFGLKALVYQMARDKDTALQWIGEAIRLNQNAASLRYKRALLLIDTRHFDEAIADCIAGETEERRRDSVYFLNSFRIMRALCLLRQGKRKEAVAAVRSVPPDYTERLEGIDMNRATILSQVS